VPEEKKPSQVMKPTNGLRWRYDKGMNAHVLEQQFSADNGAREWRIVPSADGPDDGRDEA